MPPGRPQSNRVKWVLREAARVREQGNPYALGMEVDGDRFRLACGVQVPWIVAGSAATVYQMGRMPMMINILLVAYQCLKAPEPISSDFSSLYKTLLLLY